MYISILLSSHFLCLHNDPGERINELTFLLLFFFVTGDVHEVYVRVCVCLPDREVGVISCVFVRVCVRVCVNICLHYITDCGDRAPH